jgi:hypothetical protein
MNQRRMRLVLARERLVERSRTLRCTAVEQSAALAPALRVGDQLRAAFDWIRGHPGIIAGAAVGLAVVRPRRALRWGLRLWGGWRLIKQLQHRLHTF